MTRRALFALAAAALLDPERLLWKPGKLISIPKPVVITGANLPLHFAVGDVITFGGDPRQYVVTAVVVGQLNFARLLGEGLPRFAPFWPNRAKSFARRRDWWRNSGALIIRSEVKKWTQPAA